MHPLLQKIHSFKLQTEKGIYSFNSPLNLPTFLGIDRIDSRKETHLTSFMHIEDALNIMTDFAMKHGSVQEFEFISDLMVEYESLNHDSIYENKVPNTGDFHVGIELEFFTPPHIACNDLGQLFLLKYPELVKYLTIDEDYSLDPSDSIPDGAHTLEVKILVPVAKLDEVVAGVCLVLNDIGAKLNESCGLHVHLDGRDNQGPQIFKKLVRAQDFLFSLYPDRKNNEFCAKTESEEVPALDFAIPRKAINGQCYTKLQTIEVRIASGSLDSQIIILWTNILVKIAQFEGTLSKNQTEAVQQLDISESDLLLFNESMYLGDW